MKARARRTLSGGTKPDVMERSQARVMTDSKARLDGYRVDMLKPLVQTAGRGSQEEGSPVL